MPKSIIKVGYMTNPELCLSQLTRIYKWWYSDYDQEIRDYVSNRLLWMARNA